MKYRTYLKEHIIWLCIFGGLLFSLETFLLTLSAGEWLMVYTAAALMAAYFIGTFAEYRQLKFYLSELQELTEGLDKKYLVPEMMQKGKRQEERCLYEIFCTVGRSMHEHVAGYRRALLEYKEYIEMWIHEVKVPIAAARMILVNHREHDNMLTEELERIEGYVEQALFYARSSEVEKDYLIRQISLESLVQEALLQKKRELLALHVSVNLHDLDRTVYSDSKWLAFILSQILSNSIKYAGENTLCLEIYGEETTEKVCLYIKDNGIGVKTEEIPRVFDKGFTGANGRKYQKSTGLGLYLCKKLCDRLGHDIHFNAAEEKGSEVRLIFPKNAYVEEVR